MPYSQQFKYIQEIFIIIKSGLKGGEKEVFLLRNLFYYQSNMTWLIQNANLVYVHNIRKNETKFNV